VRGHRWGDRHLGSVEGDVDGGCDQSDPAEMVVMSGCVCADETSRTDARVAS